jgi:serine/threonine-protein kinase
MQCPYQPGDRYDRFRIVEVLGDGSFAWVFAAEDSKTSQTVALKLSRTPLMSQDMAVRAKREIRILGSLTNPHVVHVTDSGVGDDGRWFMVMELLEGRELSLVHDFDDCMPADQAVDWIYQACLGLEDAHRAGIVHRDIKPSNLWVCEDGTIKVIDFGLARSWNSDTIAGQNATQGHMLVGTPHYAQPEQVKSGKLTPASDVYSLGFILYELLVGRVPLFPDRKCSEVRTTLKNDPLEWLGAHIENPVVPIDRYPEGQVLPTELRRIVHATLQKDPAKRPASGRELAEELRWVLPPERGGLAGTDVLVIDVRGPSEGREGETREHRIVVGPGRYTIGVGRCCDIELGEDTVGWVFAQIEWPDADRNPMIEPIRIDGFISMNDAPIKGPMALEPDMPLRLGAYEVTVKLDRGTSQTGPA